MGLRIKASTCAVCTRVLLVGNEEQHLHRDHLNAVAYAGLNPLQLGGFGGLIFWPSCCNSCAWPGVGGQRRLLLGTAFWACSRWGHARLDALHRELQALAFGGFKT